MPAPSTTSSSAAEPGGVDMPIITGEDSEFARLVVEEFQRRGQRVVDLGQAAFADDVDKAIANGGDHGAPDPPCGGEAQS